MHQIYIIEICVRRLGTMPAYDPAVTAYWSRHIPWKSAYVRRKHSQKRSQ